MDKYFRYEDVKDYICSFYLGNECDCDNSSGCKKLDKLPIADVVEVRHAHWIDTGSGQECSLCKEIQYGYDNGRCYCANCGAKMDAKMKRSKEDDE